MTYPYGMKGAPVVGGGAPGLPRRVVAAEAVEPVAAGLQVFQPVGDTVALAMPFASTSGPQISNFGMILGETPGRAVFKGIVFNSSTGSDNFFIFGVNYTNDGVVSTLTPHNFGNPRSVFDEFNYESSWRQDISIYFYHNGENRIYRIVSANNVSLSVFFVKENVIPSTGTLTVGGAAYTLQAGNPQIIGSNFDQRSPHQVLRMSNGDIVMPRFVIISNDVRVVVFVLNSSFNIIRSFQLTEGFSNFSSTFRRLILTVPVKESNNLFTTFVLMTRLNQGFCEAAAFTFNATTGSVVSRTKQSFNLVAQDSLGLQSTYMFGSNNAVITTHDSPGNRTITFTFEINSDLSIVASLPAFTNIFANGFLSIPKMRHYDPEFEDFYNSSNSTTYLDAQTSVSNTTGQQNMSILPVLQQNLTKTFASSTVTTTVSTLTLTAFAVLEGEVSTTQNDLGFGPITTARIGKNAYLGAYSDRATDTNTSRVNTRIMRIPS